MKLRRQPGPNYIGPLPEEVLDVRLVTRKIPSKEWQDAHPDGLADKPPSDEEMVVQCVAFGIYAEPSRLQHPANWPTGQFPVSEIFCVPYLEFKAAGLLDIKRRKGEIPDAPPPDPATNAEMQPDVTGEAAATEPEAS